MQTSSNTSPHFKGSAESDRKARIAFIGDCRADMETTAFAAASAMVGRIAGGAGIDHSAPNAKAEAVAVGTDADLLTQCQAVEKDAVSRSRFIRHHEKELLAMAHRLKAQRKN